MRRNKEVHTHTYAAANSDESDDCAAANKYATEIE